MRKKADIKTVFGRSPFIAMDGEIRKLYRQHLRNFQQMIFNASDKNPDAHDPELIEEVSLSMEAMTKAILHMLHWLNRQGAKDSGKDGISHLEILATVHILSLVKSLDELFPGEIDGCRAGTQRFGSKP